MTDYRWVFLRDPRTKSGASETFASQPEAEDYMGAEWRRLLGEGVLAARLEADGEELYTMKLTED